MRFLAVLTVNEPGPRTTFDEVVEIAAGNGYPGENRRAEWDEVSFAANGGPIGPFRGCVFFDMAGRTPRAMWYWRTQPMILADGESLSWRLRCQNEPLCAS